MHLVILLLAALAIGLYLTLLVRQDPEKRRIFYLLVVIDLWFASVFVYLVISALFDLN